MSYHHHRSHDTLIESIIKVMGFESSRNFVAYLVQNLVGDNIVESAISKLCSSNEIPLLRLVMALAIGVDPLIGRAEYVTSCRIASAGDVTELRFTADDGSELCIGIYTSGNIRVATACRASEGKTAAAGDQQLFVKIS